MFKNFGQTYALVRCRSITFFVTIAAFESGRPGLKRTYLDGKGCTNQLFTEAGIRMVLVFIFHVVFIALGQFVMLFMHWRQA